MNKELNIPILPKEHQFAKVKATHELNLEAICIFMATGFFLDDDTYWRDNVCLLPGHNHILDENNLLIESKSWFNWHYSPRDISFNDALGEYKYLLHTIVKEQVGDSPVILPLSGGLDSRSQALILKDLNNPVHAFSYSFKGGFPEHKISKQIAALFGFSFEYFQIQKGYLWDVIDELATINNCYSEFTHPRQMSVLKELRQMKGIFSLGHWGDVLFDRGVPEGTLEEDVMPLLLKKMLKPKGLELAEQLWKTWQLKGDFISYFTYRVEKSLAKIKVDNISARIRAFKTSQWAHRWTTTNLSVFEAAHPITLPYYDNRMCEFICTIPEEFLADRRLQIAHLQENKVLSKIVWQEQKPFNLTNYKFNKSPYNLLYRTVNKVQREFRSIFGNPYIQRNFELQFQGKENNKILKQYLFSVGMQSLVPKEIVKYFFDSFNSKNYVAYSHPISMLLTLAVWQQKFRK
ncbi:asparagine synthase-related protein [Ichthyenterobacterium sp. W332]|uniref:asparagine synthase (glutamine-hydrolyzing) n=1 Tax=Microcosmobacter mediterraneus TaxID=3075607 RepID=A0ABU2YGP6_9FLAO|nr:asparagine synthase-related protein [Ichthyenterobacterium sp. W332]MDT0557348.1 asparagine synthase-related protein [Ichthyenterobacterium sp. W332]